MFYQYVRTAALNQRQTQHVSVFTTELFAHYLHIRCLSVIKMLSNNKLYRLRNYVSSSQLFMADILAVKSLVFSFHSRIIAAHRSQQPALSTTDMNTSELVDLLQQSAVERLTTYRQLEVRDFGSEVTIVTTDFEALYAYKRGNYQRCLQLLPTQSVHELLYAVCITLVPTCQEFIQLLDDDIVSLTGMALIVRPECREFFETVHITQLTLSLYLMTQCQLKLRHSVTSLAQTLEYIELAPITLPAEYILDHLVLKLTKRLLLMYSI